ncbi:MAG: hypothetical protein ACF8R7_15370 [Phycisphaerales bacterium JB039]
MRTLALATSLLASTAAAQPEYLRLDSRDSSPYRPSLDVEGDLLVWTALSQWPDYGLVAHIYRRQGLDWLLEAEIPDENPDLWFGGCDISGDRIALWPQRRILRFDGVLWRDEPIEQRALLPLDEDDASLDGDYFAVRQFPDQWAERGMGTVYHFDGAVWRHQADLLAPFAGDRQTTSVALEGNLIACSTWRSPPSATPGPVAIFRRDNSGRWNTEAVLPGATGPVVIDAGRIAFRTEAGIDVYVQSSPAIWKLDATIAIGFGPGRYFALAGDTLVTSELIPGYTRDFFNRALVYRRTASGWERDRELYPSVLGPLNPLWGGVFQGSPIAYNNGEIFALTNEELWQGKWRIIGFGPCRADFNGDSVLDGADLIAFLVARSDQWLCTDYDGDGRVGDDHGDFLEFMRLFEQGCD